MKPAFSLPQRKPVDEWVERAGDRSVDPGPQPKIKVARLTIDLDPELHAKFKAACAMRRTRMIDEVRVFIEGYIQKSD
jgi:ParG protein